MPYPNEHAARLKEPSNFDPKSFRRTKDGTIYGGKKVPETVSVIWGKLKGKSKPSDNPIPQSLRFPTFSWTADKARKWLRDNNVKYIRFEAAKKQSESPMSESPMSESPTWKNYHPSDLMFKADGLAFPGRDSNSESETSFPIEVVVRTNNVIQTHMGPVIHDLHGMFHKDKVLVDWTHDRDKGIGFLDDFDVSNERVKCKGQLVSVEEGDLSWRLIKQAKAGIPFESSIYFGGQGLEIEELGEGDSTQVNGREFNGPGIVFRKWPLRGVALCSYGADNQTSVSLEEGKELVPALLLSKEKEMDENLESDVQVLEKDNSELEASSQAEDNNSEQNDKKSPTGQDFLDAFGPDGGVWFAEGKTYEQATGLYIGKLKARNEELAKRLASLDLGDKEAIDFQDDPKDNPGESELRKRIGEFTNVLGGNLARFAAGIKIKR